MRSRARAELPGRAAVCRGAVLVVLLTGLTGCGFLAAMADPPVTPPPSASVPPTPVEAPAEPRVVVAAQLADDRELPGSPFRSAVTVAVHPVASGLPGLVGFGTDCGYADDGTTRQLAVDLTVANQSGSVANVAADVSLAGPTADAVGVFVESGTPGVRWCQDGDRTPTADHLVVDGGVGDVRTTTIYVVAGPDAPADPFAGLTLELTGLQNTAYSYPELVTVGTWTASTGSCPDQPDSLCAPLG